MFKKIFFLLTSIFSLSSPCNVLSLSGGGSFGVNEIAILDNLSNNKLLPHFDIITGISAGGLNAGYLNFFDDISKGLDGLKNVYFNIKNDDVYHQSNFFDIFKNYSLLNNTDLQNLMEEVISPLEKFGNQKHTLIGATNVFTGKLEIFPYHILSLEEKIDVLMATSAIPFVFPPRIINGTPYVDGGTLENEIIVPFSENCKEYNIFLIHSHDRFKEIDNISNFFQYTKRIFDIVSNNFNEEIDKIKFLCDDHKVNITYCFPDTSLLDNYSILDFDKGKELYELVYENFKCIPNYC
jgi:predicted acylesterase/phospholipase RssA